MSEKGEPKKMTEWEIDNPIRQDLLNSLEMKRAIGLIQELLNMYSPHQIRRLLRGYLRGKGYQDDFTRVGHHFGEEKIRKMVEQRRKG